MYIVDSAAISPQQTFDDTFFQGNVRVYRGARYAVIEPDYGNLIPAGLLRRMGKAVRIGVGAGLPLVRQHDIEGIILGTANGGLEDCLKFLNQIVDYEEGTLTPTNFVQSTPNAVAGNLALMIKVTGYNVTHVHKGLAFETALLDAIMLFQEKKIGKLLLGSVEEISDYNHNIDFLSGAFKDGDYDSNGLLHSGTPGSVSGEGATMFVVENTKSREGQPQIRDVLQTSFLSQDKTEERLSAFLQKNNLRFEDIDALLMGVSGDSRTDHLYMELQQRFFGHAAAYSYKNLVGDYATASAFAAWLAAGLLEGKVLPTESLIEKGRAGDVRNVLVYNHVKGVQHGFILLGK